MPIDSASKIHLRLLGPFGVALDDQPMPPVRSRSGMHLLALLALHANREVARDWLAGTLWPDSLEEQALANLRRTLTDLRRVLGGASARLLSPNTHTLLLHLTENECDLLAFDSLLKESQPAAWSQAVALYRGPLLADLYQTWIEAERATRQEGYLHALEQLAQYAREQGDWREAAHYLRLAITADPLRESLSAALMEALAQGGDPAEAIQVFRILRLHLHEAFGNADPSPELVALYHRLRAETLQRPATLRLERHPAEITPSSAHNLPQRITAFVGREQERSALEACLSTSRLVTLTGTGGIGKTRLALEVAEEQGNAFRDGVWLVELAAVTEATLIPNTVAQVLGLREEVGKPILETVLDALRSRQMLLVLDNCEHLLAACARLTNRLLQSCRGLRILVTSQQALGITGEALFPVHGLEVPPQTEAERNRDKGWLSALTEYAAIQLFLQRGQAILPTLQLTAQNSGAIIEICRRLDGIPLAIELAAARLRVLTVAQIAQRLDDCFYLLTGGSRTALPRHQTLQAALDWSYELLEPDEQALLQRLGVFAGGATLEEVEKLCADSADLAQQALDLMQQLVDKSFVRTEPIEGAVRYRLLETTRLYALKKLEATGNTSAIRQRHSEIYAALLEQTAPEIEGDHAVAWMNRVTEEKDNIRAALEWLIRPEASPEDVELSRKMILYSLARLWKKRLNLRELSYWAERVLARDRSSTPSRTELEMEAGATALRQGEVSVAQAHFENGYQAFLVAGDESGTLLALIAFGKVAEYVGDYTKARNLYARCLSGYQARNDPRGIVGATNNLGSVALAAGDYTAARNYHEACLAMGYQREAPVGVAWSLNNLAEVSLAEGNVTEARRLFKESLTLFVENEQRLGLTDCLQGLGEIACSHLEDIPGARIAARLLGAADQMRSLSGIVLPPRELIVHENAVLQAQQALGEEAFRIEWRIGSQASLEETILFASET